MLPNRCSQKITLCFNPQKLPKLEINSKKLSGQHKKKKEDNDYPNSHKVLFPFSYQAKKITHSVARFPAKNL